MAVEEVPQIPTYKLLPPMYQLAARLGTSGNLNDLVIKVASQLHNCFFDFSDLLGNYACWPCQVWQKHIIHICPPCYNMSRPRLVFYYYIPQLITKTAREHPYHVLPILFALKNAQLDCKYIKGSKHLPNDVSISKCYNPPHVMV